MDPEHGDASRAEPPLSRAALILAALAICAPLLAPLGAPGLMNPDEGRYAEIGREMAATGDWLVPRLHGIPHWAKPPLAYWAIGASMKVLGPTERAARLPSAIAATLTLLATWVLARRMGGSRLALLAVMILASMLEFHFLARLATCDMIQTACITWAATLLWIARSPRGAPRRRILEPARLAAFACLGISFVDKGPVALGVTACALALFMLFRPRSSLLSWKDLAAGIPLVLAIGLPWFLLVLRLNPGLQEFFLKGEVQQRVLGEHGRGKPFWFLPAIFVAGTMPWTAALAASLGRTVAGLRRPHDAAGASDDADRFLLAWIVGPFLLFAFAGSKLAHYLLPLMPFCAVAAARWIRALEHRERSRGWILALASGPPILAWAAGLTAVLAYDGLPSRWITGAVSVTVLSACSVFVIRRKHEAARPAIMTASMAVLTWAWIGFVAVTAEGAVNFRAHASQRWIRETLEAEAVRGVPIGTAVAAPTGDRVDESVSMATFKIRANSIPLYALGMRPEYFPDFNDPEGWEMHADRARAPGWALDDLVARLRQPRRMFVLSDEDALPQLEAALGRPLRRIASHGVKKHAVVLVSNGF